MNFWKSMEGMVTGELTSADPGEALRIINEKGIRLYRVEWKEELTVTFQCSRRDKKAISEICCKRGDSLQISEVQGLYYVMISKFHRPVLVAGLFLLFCLTMILPTRAFFFQVEGNETIPARQILEAAESCGIRFGVSRRIVRSERMKNALLSAMPELQWAGINTMGCTAVISVREREAVEEKTVSSGVSSIVAVRDGYVTSCTVTRGNAVCAPGQVVQEGELLISGYTDCGICIQVTGADGEIYAETNRTLRSVTPDECIVRVGETVIKHRYSLILGKKRINLWKDSGISTATCGRMYKECYISLPGGFRLPVGIVEETVTDYITVVTALDLEEMEVHLRDFTRKTILQQTVAGSILREQQIMTQGEGIFVLEGNFLCSEMIGRTITEEIGETNGKDS